MSLFYYHCCAFSVRYIERYINVLFSYIEKENIEQIGRRTENEMCPMT